MSKEKDELFLRDIAREIGYFYFRKYDSCTSVLEQVVETRKELDDTKITSIAFKEENILITTSRPGILIGRHGENIKSLTEYLRKRFTFNQIGIVEETILKHMYSFEYALGID